MQKCKMLLSVPGATPLGRRITSSLCSIEYNVLCLFFVLVQSTIKQSERKTIYNGDPQSKITEKVNLPLNESVLYMLGRHVRKTDLCSIKTLYLILRCCKYV